MKTQYFCTREELCVEIYKKVQAYIKESGYKQVSVAQKAGIPNSTFYAMMTGRRTIYADDLRAICIALNVKPEKFVDWKIT